MVLTNNLINLNHVAPLLFKYIYYELRAIKVYLERAAFSVSTIS